MVERLAEQIIDFKGQRLAYAKELVTARTNFKSTQRLFKSFSNEFI